MRYAFGPFELDTSTLELVRDGEPVGIEPQVFELLAYLIENRNRVLSKDDLIEAVWGGRIVSDAAVSSRIKLVRRAVDDDGTRQGVIKTVHGKGFRFIGDVQVGVAAVEAGPVGGQAAPASQVESRRLLIPIGLVAAALVALFLLVRLIPGGGGVPENRIAVLPVINETDDPSLDWAELGLMSLLTHELEARTELPLVKASTVMTLSERFPMEDTAQLVPPERLQNALEAGYGASHVLSSRLTGSPGNLTLEYRMLNPRGQSSATLVAGQSVAELAAEVSRQVAASLPRSGERRLEVPSEAFDDLYVAETYARGLDMQMKGKGEEAADLFRVAAAHDPDNLKVRYELAVSTRMAGDLDDAEAQFKSLITEAVENGDTAIQGTALNGLGVLYLTRRDDEQALKAYQEALQVLETGESSEIRAFLLTNIGIVQRRLRNYEAAEEVLGRALVEFQAAGFETPPGHLLNALALLKVQTRDVPTANEYLTQALAAFRLVGDRASEAVALHNIGTNAMSLGQLDKAATFLTNALEMRTEMGDTRGQISSLAALAELSLDRGDTAGAAAHIDAMTERAQEAGDDYSLARAETLAAHVDFASGDWQAAIMHSQAAEAGFTALLRTRNAYREQIHQAVIRAYEGSTAERSKIEDVLTWAKVNEQQGTQLSCFEALTIVSVLARDYDQASTDIDAALDLSVDMQLNTVTGRLAARQGLIRLIKGDETGAIASLGRAKVGNPEHHETLLLDALLASATGDTALGESRLAKVKATAGDNWHPTEHLFHAILNKP